MLKAGWQPPSALFITVVSESVVEARALHLLVRLLLRLHLLLVRRHLVVGTGADGTIAFSVLASDNIKVSVNEAKARTFNSAQKRVIDSIGGNDDVRVANSIGRRVGWRVAPAMTCSKEMPAMA